MNRNSLKLLTFVIGFAAIINFFDSTLLASSTHGGGPRPYCWESLAKVGDPSLLSRADQQKIKRTMDNAKQIIATKKKVMPSYQWPTSYDAVWLIRYGVPREVALIDPRDQVFRIHFSGNQELGEIPEDLEFEERLRFIKRAQGKYEEERAQAYELVRTGTLSIGADHLVERQGPRFGATWINLAGTEIIDSLTDESVGPDVDFVDFQVYPGTGILRMNNLGRFLIPNSPLSESPELKTLFEQYHGLQNSSFPAPAYDSKIQGAIDEKQQELLLAIHLPVRPVAYQINGNIVLLRKPE